VNNVESTRCWNYRCWNYRCTFGISPTCKNLLHAGVVGGIRRKEFDAVTNGLIVRGVGIGRCVGIVCLRGDWWWWWWWYA